MSVRRIFVEKKPAYAVKAGSFKNWKIIRASIMKMRVSIRYDIENLSERPIKRRW